jgi:hypothetical protein
MAFLRNLFKYKRTAQPPFEESRKYWLEEELRKIERALDSMVTTYNPSYIGSFYSTEDQSHATINTPQAITFNNSAYELGVSRGTPTSRLYLDNLGYYNLEFTAQFNNTSASTSGAKLWIRYNGVDLPNSTTPVDSKSNNSFVEASWNYTCRAENSGDYVELLWLVNDTGLILNASPAGANYPASSSVRLTITQIGI